MNTKWKNNAGYRLPEICSTCEHCRVRREGNVSACFREFTGRPIESTQHYSITELKLVQEQRHRETHNVHEHATCRYYMRGKRYED